MKQAFLICPVRGKDPSETEGYCKEVEALGFAVHWPPRDTNQADETGFRICQDNLKAIEKADMVFFVWDGNSQGCLFDLGMAFALGKSVSALKMPPLTDGKSFQNMVKAWSAAGAD